MNNFDHLIGNYLQSLSIFMYKDCLDLLVYNESVHDAKLQLF